MRIATTLCLVLAAALTACSPAGREADAALDSVADDTSSNMTDGIPLKGTRWELTDVGGTAVTPGSTARVPYFLLRTDEDRVEGSGSCNGMSGPYELDGPDLRFGPLISTKMACEPGMDVEIAFFVALDQTRTWAITGETLQLSDSTGTVVAQLRAAQDTTAP